VLNSISTSGLQQSALISELEKTRGIIADRNDELYRAFDSARQLQERCKTLTASREKYRKESKKAKQKLVRATKTHAAESTQRLVYHIKEKGHLSDPTFYSILELTKLDIPSRHMYRVFLIMADMFNIELKGSFSETSVLRTIDIGGYAGLVQIGEAMANATSEWFIFLSMSIDAEILQRPHLAVMVHLIRTSTIMPSRS
jgi:hypothetical protein